MVGVRRASPRGGNSTRVARRTRVRTEKVGMSLSEFEAELIRLEGPKEKKKILVYGDSNVGKTVLAGSTPGKTFWLFGEPGYHSAANFGAKSLGRRVNSTAAAMAAIDWLRHKDRYTRLDWLIVDGASTMEKRFRLGYAAEAFDANPTKRAHRNLPDRPDYFNTQNMIFSWIADLIDLDVNLLILAHAYRTDKTDADLLVFPGFQGKVTETANGISGLMDSVGYMSRRNDVSRILWHRHTTERGVTYYAGDKFNKLPKLMKHPTMPAIISTIDGESIDEDEEE